MKANNTEEYQLKFGPRVPKLRKDGKPSKNDLAYNKEIDKPNLRKIEKGKLNITLSTMIKLCDAFGIKLKDLFDLE